MSYCMTLKLWLLKATCEHKNVPKGHVTDAEWQTGNTWQCLYVCNHPFTKTKRNIFIFNYYYIIKLQRCNVSSDHILSMILTTYIVVLLTSEVFFRATSITVKMEFPISRQWHVLYCVLCCCVLCNCVLAVVFYCVMCLMVCYCVVVYVILFCLNAWTVIGHVVLLSVMCYYM